VFFSTLLGAVVRGRFITFEGGEGSGKSTQTRLLADRLERCGIAVVRTREPGGSPGAEAIRHVLLAGAAKPLGPFAEAILFAAARDDHLRHTIRPALNDGRWVISDRFADSTRVYQGVLGGLDGRLISILERITLADTYPDLTIILDVPAELGLKRATERRGEHPADRFERETNEYHRRLRSAYLQLAEREPRRCVAIDGSAEPARVADAIWSVVSDRLRPAAAPEQLADAAR
jgi:dTMP kinase